jgi:NTP pyrophosphatase (non-canonical NTP hydrolase)
MNSFSELQSETQIWRAKNFPGQASDASRQIAGMMEELGELAHAWLKQDQGIRGDEDLEGLEMDAIGDLIIYLCGYCSARGIFLSEAIARAWHEVKERDWQKYPMNGRTA